MTRYLIPLDLLLKAAHLLQPPEKVCFVAGVKLFDVLGDHMIVLTRLIPVECDASRTHAAPHPAAVLRIQQHLLQLGLDVEAQFHSHPGSSHHATHPSPIDLQTARAWETGAPFLGAIFSEGGRFVRFFGGHQQSEVNIYGKGSRLVEPLCFELPQITDNLLQAQEDQPEGLVLNRPSGEILLVEPKEDSRG